MPCPELRPYQTDVVERVRQRAREGHRRIVLQAPCGSGKSTMSSEVIRAGVAKGKRWLFLAHMRKLIRQKVERLAQFGITAGVIMAGERRDPSALVQVASRDTLLSRAVRNDWLELPDADGIVVDECHHVREASEYEGLLGRYPDALIIGLSATPAGQDGRGMGPPWTALECAVQTSRLIADGHLVPVRCYSPERSKGDRKGLVGDPVAHWLRLGRGRPTALFAAKRSESLAAAEAFRAAGITAEHIDQHTPDADREDAFARLRSGKTEVLCNVGICTEGLDVPEIACIVLLRRCGSYVLFAQIAGRAMRPAPGKSDGILIDHAGAALRHGLPHEDVEWTLDASDTVDRRNKEKRKAGERPAPCLCPNCALLFTGTAACPGCGHVLPRRKQRAKTLPGLLVEVEGRAWSQAQRKERDVRLWRRCLAVAVSMGRTVGMASCMFKRETGYWPSDDLPMPARREFVRRPAKDVYPQAVRGAAP